MQAGLQADLQDSYGDVPLGVEALVFLAFPHVTDVTVTRVRGNTTATPAGETASTS